MSTTTALDQPFAQVRPARRRTLRSVGAVLGGLVATVIATTVIDMILHATGVFPPLGVRMGDGLFLLALAYRIPMNVGGSYVAARLAPDRPLRHALALGGVGVVLATLGAIAFGDQGPLWYSLANIAIAMPCAWVGGTIRRP